MSVSDPISNLIVSIKNASAVGKHSVVVPHSSFKTKILDVLVSEGFIASYDVVNKDKVVDAIKNIVAVLKYTDTNKPVISEIKRVSKPGRRVYCSADNVPNFAGGIGSVIISTSKGLMTDADARRAGVGGEVVLKVM